MDFDRDFGVNQGFVEDQYERWRDNPAAVDLDWQQYFSRLAGLPAPQAPQGVARAAPAPLTSGDRHGNRAAALAPTLPLREIIARLKRTYCRTIGAEFMHGEDPVIRRWLQERMEATGNEVQLSREEKLRILGRLTDAETLETFLHKKYIGAKRFSLEGGESLIPLMDWLIEEFGERGGEEIVIGMAHRGRLNILANILHKDLTAIFAEFEDKDAQELVGRGDVKYHLGD